MRFSRTLSALLFLASIGLIVFDRPDVRPQVFSVFRATVVDLASPMLALAGDPLRRIRNVGPYFRNQAALADENARLRQELNEARYWRDLAFRLRDQVEVYEEALNLDAPVARERVGAWVIADPQGPFVRSRLIGAGENRGVQAGHPVLNVYGLVGRVVETGRRSSRVLLLTDLNSRVPVMADRSNARAVLAGDNTPFPVMEYIGREADLIDGDRIVTSGDDGVLPRGLPVGQAIRDRHGRWRVQLFSDLAPVDFVWVFPYERVPPPEQDRDALTFEPLRLESPAPVVQAEPAPQPQSVVEEDEEES